MLGDDPGGTLGSGRSPLLPAQRGSGTRCLQGRALLASPHASCLVPCSLTEPSSEPIWFSPIGGFPGCGQLNSNILRRFQRQESDPRLPYRLWERGRCVMAAGVRGLSRAGAAVSPVCGRPPGEEAGSASRPCFHPAPRRRGSRSLRIGRGGPSAAAALQCLVQKQPGARPCCKTEIQEARNPSE